MPLRRFTEIEALLARQVELLERLVALAENGTAGSPEARQAVSSAARCEAANDPRRLALADKIVAERVRAKAACGVTWKPGNPEGYRLTVAAGLTEDQLAAGIVPGAPSERAEKALAFARTLKQGDRLDFEREARQRAGSRSGEAEIGEALAGVLDADVQGWQQLLRERQANAAGAAKA